MKIIPFFVDYMLLMANLAIVLYQDLEHEIFKEKDVNEENISRRSTFSSNGPTN